MNEKGIVIFVEGETDQVFYKMLIKFLNDKYKLNIPLSKIIIHNVKGIGNYKSAPNMFKGRILRDNPNTDFYAICSYDSDVFEGNYMKKPRVDWDDVEKRLKKYHAIDVIHIKAKHCIEDWFLLDKEGICKFLKVRLPKNLSGKNGIEKINKLFKSGNKIYQKGFYVYKFLDFLDFELIFSKLEPEFKPLVDILITLK